MTQTSGHVRGGFVLGSDDREVESKIPWLETDARRAPLRNDVISALEGGLGPALFWFAFFRSYYEPRTAAIAATIVAIATFGVTFVVSWARMTTARRWGATQRSPRTRARAALVMAVVVGVCATLTPPGGFSGDSFDLALGLVAGAFAGAVLLVLETFAVDVPAVPPRRRREYWL